MLGAVASAAIPVVAGVLGKGAAAGDQARANEMAQQAFSYLKEVGLPPDVAKEIVYKQYQQMGVYSPEMEQAIEQESSAMAGVQEAPELRQAQMEALQALQQRGKIGLSAEDRAALNTVRRDVQKDAEAKRQQILMDAAARGQSGSGMELIAQLQGAASAQDIQSQESDRLAAQAAQQALQSIQNSAGLAGNMRTQDFGIASDKARAEDILNQFNVENSRDVQQRNVASRNQGQLANLAEKQRIADANIAMANQEKLRQQNARSDVWQNKLDYAKTMSGGATQQSQAAANRAAGTAGEIAGIGAGIGGMFNAYQGAKDQAAQRAHETSLAEMKYGKKNSIAGATYDPQGNRLT